MEDIDGGLHPAVDGQSLDERWKMKCECWDEDGVYDFALCIHWDIGMFQ